MKSKFVAVMLGLAVCIFTAASAEACSRKIPARAAKTVVPAAKIDQNLLDAAIRGEVNYHRCRAGLKLLANGGGRLGKQTQIHSKWMAKARKLSHRNNVSGSVSLQQRIKTAGIKAKAGAENIGMVSRYRIDGQSFRIVDSASCQFTTQSGQPLPAHSYASLARHIVNLWMNSSGHRKNILNRKVSMVRTAVAFDPRAQYCGRFWLTQTLVG